MAERNVSTGQVVRVLTEGKVIEDYPEDSPYPSKLLLAWIDARPFHVVAAHDTEQRRTIVITVYEPNSSEWETGFERRRKP